MPLNNQKIEELVISENVEEIQSNIFEKSLLLKSIIINDASTTIADYAFHNIKTLEKINNLKKIQTEKELERNKTLAECNINTGHRLIFI